jgi:hypothetical protein
MNRGKRHIAKFFADFKPACLAISLEQEIMMLQLSKVRESLPAMFAADSVFLDLLEAN